MRTLLSDGAVTDDTWSIVEDSAVKDGVPDGDILLSLQSWRATAAARAGHNGRIGVWLENTDEPEALEPELRQLPVLAVRFPAFNDGRGLSTAVLLRTRLGFSGDLRAIGDVQLDQLSYMRRCGFTSFAVRSTDDVEAMRAALVVMSNYYQGSVLEPRPLFGRR